MQMQPPPAAGLDDQQAGGQGGDQMPSEGGGDPASEVGKLVMNVSKGMTMLAEIMDKIPETAPEDKEAMASLLDGFHGLVQKLAGGGAPAEAAPQPAKAQGVPMQDPQGRLANPSGM